MLRLLLLIGVLQGWALWGLWKARELHIWPNTDALSERGLLYLFLALPLAIYLTESVTALSRKHRIQILVGLSLLFTLLGAYSGWADNIIFDSQTASGYIPFARPSDLLAATVLLFVSVPLLAHFNIKARGWAYPDLFETAWRNAILCLSAGFLTGVFWIVLFAGSELLHLIGLSFMKVLIKESTFAIPVSCIAFGTAYSLALARAEMVITLRRFKLSMLAWMLPLLMMFVIVWVVALPFTGVESLFNTHSAAYILLWCAALCISFINAAYQDGITAPPYGKYLNQLLAWGWLALPIVVAVATWAMWLRIEQYGWSEDRVWGMFVMLMAMLHVVGYAASALRSKGWLASIGKTNMWSAFALCIGLIALLTPIADARRIAVNSQMQRLTSQITPVEKFDFDYLRWQAGRHGQNALHTLASGIIHPEQEKLASQAKQLLAQNQRYQTTESISSMSDTEKRQHIQMLPSKALLSVPLLKALGDKSSGGPLETCFNIKTKCAIWLVDLNADRALDAVVLVKYEWGKYGQALVLKNINGNYQLVGRLANTNESTYDQLLDLIERGEFKIVNPKWREIELAGKRIQVEVDYQER